MSDPDPNFLQFSVVSEQLIDLNRADGICLLLVRSLRLAGIENSDQAKKNLQEWSARLEAAARGGFHLECLSLLLHQIDLWLRLFIANKTRQAVDRKRPFGSLVNESRELGLWSTLCEDISAFNEARIAAIHHYLLGGCDYGALRLAYLASDGLEKHTACSVIAKVSEPFITLPADDDFFLIQWPGRPPSSTSAWSCSVKGRIELAKRGQLDRPCRP